MIGKIQRRFLKALELEHTVLHRLLSNFQEKDWGFCHSAGSSELRELKKDLFHFSGKMIIFHFSGHTNETQIQLEGTGREDIRLAGTNLLAFLLEEPQLKNLSFGSLSL